MSYAEKMELVKKELILYCNERVTENMGNYFDMWMMAEADMEFGHGYQSIFKKHFEQRIDNDLETFLWHYGKNLIYAIQAFMQIQNKNYKIHKLLQFVESFITNQLDDFDNSYEDLMMSFPNASDETETQNNENNPV
jgi:hypothetical protein